MTLICVTEEGVLKSMVCAAKDTVLISFLLLETMLMSVIVAAVGCYFMEASFAEVLMAADLYLKMRDTEGFCDNRSCSQKKKKVNKIKMLKCSSLKFRCSVWA